ncbi:MAG: Gfo/Idh/MocA family oxidoreductase [Deltaproteobacteria bacterium]|nr:Gfo/Idh/MocA family oxidoreductase [Deltaproteobacteria bacterium]
MKTRSDIVKVGVVGVGSMGRNHARVLSQVEECDFVGIYDVNEFRAGEICASYGCKGFRELDKLLNEVDAVVVAAPTWLHGELGEKCLGHGIHVLMEKPLAANLEEAEKLVRLSEENDLILMVGHIERYNPAVSLMIDIIKKNREPVISIEARRLNPFDGTRCLDVDVLYDLLIHDIDLALEIADSDIVDIFAVGRKVYSNLIDDAHILVQFENGITAVFWTSKCSPRKIREINVTTRTRFFQSDTISRTLTIHSAKDITSEVDGGICLMGDFVVEEFCRAEKEPLRAEIEDFLDSIKNNRSPITDGRRALDSLMVLDQIAKSLNSN